ncbi:hypothetical protein [Pseudomonas alloputida]|uniref:hypothetical protein n=1 Tax=Pseudomonas alloputida TaxID=1940621 RepID=UPI00117DC556|nr:hypothetical protein [Pseudomonas alloputida]
MSAPRQNKTASERVRQAYRRLITAWRTRRSLEPDPGLDDLQIAAEMLAGDTGLVYSRYLKDDTLAFVLSVPAWSFSDRDELRIEHSRDGVVWTTLHQEIVEYFDKPIDNPHPVQLDKGSDQMTLEGIHYFRSWVQNPNPDTSVSKPLALIFDRFPPYNHISPPKFPSIPVVTDESLGAASDKAVLTLPSYPDWAEGDKVFVYWMNRLPLDAADLDEPVLRLDTTGADQQLEIAGADIRRVGDGGVFVVYLLIDKAGNVSEISIYTSIAVALGQLPTVFDPPVVPLATVDDAFLIDQADANEGVEVWVPVYEDKKASDFVEVKWGGTPLQLETVGSAPDDFIRVRVPHEVMLKEYGSGSGQVPTKVSYTLLRGSHPMGGADIDIQVDFETMDPGGPDPTWPLPIHPDLKKVVITGRNSGLTDELDETDAKSPADLAFELYNFAEEDDELTFYWVDEVAATHTVGGSDKSGESIDLEVPWEVIEKIGNHSAVPVYYEARRPGVHNPVRSATTFVKVEAITITPVAATFDHLVKGVVTCTSIQATGGDPKGPAVEVLIPNLTEYQQHGEFTKVDLTWWVYRGRTDEQGYEEIDNVRFEEQITLDAEHPITGFTWRIPFDKYVLPTDEGSKDPLYMSSRANVTYALKMAKGDVLSEVAKVRLSFIPPSGTCNPYGS